MINEIFSLLFPYFVLELWCVFHTYSAPSLDELHFKCSVATCTWQLLAWITYL